MPLYLNTQVLNLRQHCKSTLRDFLHRKEIDGTDLIGGSNWKSFKYAWDLLDKMFIFEQKLYMKAIDLSAINLKFFSNPNLARKLQY